MIVLNTSRSQFVWSGNWLYPATLLLIIAGSFFCYAPLFHPQFDSDHAIHVIMSTRSDYPQGIYYWGQNRLGSFLPEVSHYLIRLTGIYPLTAVSLVNHFFLMTFFFLMATALKTKTHRLFLALFIFFPFYTFNALLLVGHPYCSQLFAGITGLLLLRYSMNQLLDQDHFSRINIWLAASAGLFLLGISLWVSESSLLFFLFAAVYFLIDKDNRNKIISVFYRNRWPATAFLMIQLSVLVLWFFKIRQFKNYFPKNEFYDQTFLTNSGEIQQQFGWMRDKFFHTLSFSQGEYASGCFAWLVLLTGIIFLISNRKKRTPLSRSLGICLLVGSLALFFSTWNFRSQFEPRYYTLLFPFLILWLLIHSEKAIIFKGQLNFIFPVLLVLFSLGSNYPVLIPRQPGVVERFGEFARLEKGTMIGNYWQVYRACAIHPRNLIPIPKEGDPFRNEHQLKEAMEQKIIYVIKTDFLEMEKPMPDTLRQYGYILIRTDAKEYNIGNVIFGCYRVVLN